MPVSYPESFKSFGLKLCSQRDLELWCRCRGDVPTLTWPGDLTLEPRRSKVSHKMCYCILGRCAVVFEVSGKNRWGGAESAPPPSSARDNRWCLHSASAPSWPDGWWGQTVQSQFHANRWYWRTHPNCRLSWAAIAEPWQLSYNLVGEKTFLVLLAWTCTYNVYMNTLNADAMSLWCYVQWSVANLSACFALSLENTLGKQKL